ncbi:MAG TPA: hypothetical protein VHB47_05875 [Thermoanaerobaculia bacterium]|jgi:hypothetical protein|nr:hypothetical protein [Thermoanaerobaculia bacterium]
MTVGIAALCKAPEGGLMVIGAADRMLSTPDTEYEPAERKLWSLSDSIAAVGSGDTELIAELLTPVKEIVQERGPKQQGGWLVESVARVYQARYKTVKAARSESELLTPLGLTWKTFISRQKELNDTVAVSAATELWKFKLPGVEILFAGTDRKGTHIFYSDDGALAWRDQVGFAAVGVGAQHASSQLMFRRHSKYASAADTLFSVYSAKKRAEVAPGVGKATDMFVIGPQLGSFYHVPEPILDQLEVIYQGAQKKGERAVERSRQKLEELYAKLEKDAEQTKPQASAGPEQVVGES